MTIKEYIKDIKGRIKGQKSIASNYMEVIKHKKVPPWVLEDTIIKIAELEAELVKYAKDYPEYMV